jgi:MEDS: MEthanogen/methylotroph, DcmR Sensory domain
MDLGVRPAPNHTCEFFGDDTHLVTSVAAALRPGFALRQAVIVIATPAHLAALDTLLDPFGRLGSAKTSGRYLLLDADLTLRRLSTAGRPDRRKFEEVVGAPLADALARYGGVRAYGEMVSLLWMRGQHEAALELEELWNELIGSHPIALLCGYAAKAFPDGASSDPAMRVSRLHAGSGAAVGAEAAGD